MLDWIRALPELLDMLLSGSLRFERSELIVPAALLPVSVIVFALLARRNLSRALKVLEAGSGRRVALALLYAVNLASKLVVALLLALLILKPYAVSKVTVPIEKEIESKYMEEEALFVVMIDCSNSMAEAAGNETKLDAAKRLARLMLDEIPENDKVVVAFFADSVVASTSLNASREDAYDLLASFNKTRDYTSIGNAVSYALSLARLGNWPTAVVLISDGENNGGADPLDVARRAATLNVTITTVLVGGPGTSNPALLEEMARLTNGTFIDVSGGFDPSSLPRLIARRTKYSALRRNVRLEEVVEVKDYERPFTLAVKSLVLAVIVMLLTGV